MSQFFKSNRIIIVLAVVAVLIAFNLQTSSTKSKLETDFETWLESYENLPSEARANAGAAHVTIKSKIPAFQISWQLQEGNDSSANDKLRRILDLLREANLYSVGKVTDVSESSDGLVLTAGDAKNVFRVMLSEDDILSNVKAQNMLKLFQIYSAEKAAVPASSSSPFATSPSQL